MVQSSCSCELDPASGATHPAAGFCSLRGTVAAQLLPIGATRPVGQDALMGWDEISPIFLLHKFSA